MIEKTIKCSNCNSNLDVPEGISKIFCLYCGNPNLLADTLETQEGGLKCLSCGNRNKDEKIFCSKCGSKLQKRCPFCGEIHSQDTIFCSKTGHNIKEHESELEKLLNALILIPTGSFYMGHNGVAKPIHHVTVNSFYIGKYPVTNKEYCLYDPKHNNPGDDLPVVNVSWDDAVKYCEWLSNKIGKNYRLPTEAEWEYACRAGTTTKYYWGDNTGNSYCWYKRNSERKIHPVGQKLPNAWGLYDMSGNVYEWCSDWYGGYTSEIVSNPVGPTFGSYRVRRGGAWDDALSYCRSADRGDVGMVQRSGNIGFRLSRTL